MEIGIGVVLVGLADVVGSVFYIENWMFCFLCNQYIIDIDFYVIVFNCCIVKFNLFVGDGIFCYQVASSVVGIGVCIDLVF